MPFSVENFRNFLGLGVEGQPAVGLLVLSKSAGHENEAFDIPTGTIFQSRGQSFETKQDFHLTESATQIEVAVEAQEAGSQGNLASMGHWNTDINNLLIEQPNDFTNGSDDKEGLYPSAPNNVGYPDLQIQFCLDLSEQVIRDQLQLKEGEDLDLTDPRVVQASNLLCMYALQNNTIQELAFANPTLQDVSPMHTKYFRANIFAPLMMQVSRLLSHKKNYQRMINPEPASA